MAMLAGDRRRAQRIVFGENSPLRLWLRRGQDPQSGIVLDISKRGIRVQVSLSIAETLDPSIELRNVRLELAGRRRWDLPEVRILDKRPCENGMAELRIVVRDEHSLGVLWSALWYLHRYGKREQWPTTVPPSSAELPRIPARGVYTEEARLERLAFIQNQTGLAMASLANTGLTPERLTGNIENLVGSVEVPVGLVGPLLFHGEHARGTLFAPFATTEGALVASATRGSIAISESGGVSTRVVRQQMLRVPLFVLTDVNSAFLFAQWLRDHYDEIREQTLKVSRHARLTQLEPFVAGNHVNVRFLYETGDAAGQNMTTTCTWHACQWVMQQMQYFQGIKFTNFWLDGSMSGDKKVNYYSFIAGRGTRVVAECFLTREVVEKVLKVSPEDLAEAHHIALMGSIHIGMVGFNVNVANVIAAMFTATGQDIACVHESSLGVLNIQQVGDGLHASMLLPSLIVGTIGGGTHLTQQNEYLKLLGCAGPGQMARLAEIIAGYCLALDLSTGAAIASDQFARAHESLGRNRPVQFITKADLHPQAFEPGLREAFDDESISVLAMEPIANVKLGSSINTELTARRTTAKLVGHFPLRLTYMSIKEPIRSSVEVMVKVKPLDDECIVASNTMAAMCEPKLAQAWTKFKHQLGWEKCHIRELDIYRMEDPRFRELAPKLYGILEDPTREAYILVLERLRDLELMDSTDDISGWTPVHIETAIQGIAEFHAIGYRKEQEFLDARWMGHVRSAKSMVEMQELWDALLTHLSVEFARFVTREDVSIVRRLIASVGSWWAEIDQMPKTLVHNDFNPRNIAFRRIEGQPRLCAYDWEMATINLPQHDLAELLVFVLDPAFDMDMVHHYVEVHRKALEHASGFSIDAQDWQHGFQLCVHDLIINRLAQYGVAHTFRHYKFMNRAATTARRLI